MKAWCLLQVADEDRSYFLSLSTDNQSENWNIAGSAIMSVENNNLEFFKLQVICSVPILIVCEF